MNITEKIKFHFENKLFCKIQRKFDKINAEKSSGYIVDFSERFVILQEIIDFNLCGYLIFTIDSIEDISFKNKDKYYDKIMQLEGLKNQVSNKYKLELSNWSTVFNSIKSWGFNVIIENENPEDKSFDIGPIMDVTNTSVSIRYFNAFGFKDEESTEISWNLITMVKFDDRYANIFGKYLRERKRKK
jgi:hypothetical protein